MEGILGVDLRSDLSGFSGIPLVDRIAKSTLSIREVQQNVKRHGRKATSAFLYCVVVMAFPMQNSRIFRVWLP
jgi:hypothetical protein